MPALVGAHGAADAAQRRPVAPIHGFDRSVPPSVTRGPHMKAGSIAALLAAWAVGSFSVAQSQSSPDSTAKTTHRVYSGMRSGVIHTANGWNAKDFAASLMNPNATDIVLVWKLI